MKGSAFFAIMIAWSGPFLFMIVLILATTVQFAAWEPPLVWTDSFSSNSVGGFDEAMAVATDATGAYVAGVFNQRAGQEFTLTGTANGSYVETGFLRKYDLGGHLMWTQTMASNIPTYQNAAAVSGLAQSSDGVYLAANMNNTASIMKYDRAGNKIWASQIDSSSSDVKGISTSAGLVYVIGATAGKNSTDFVRAYDFGGTLKWNETMSQPLGLESVSANPLGVYVLTTSSLMRYDLNGHRVWTQSILNGFSLTSDPNAVYIAKANYAQKYGADGSVLWSTQPQQSSYDLYSSITTDSSGVYVSTQSQPPNDYLVKYDFGGRQLWSITVPLSVSPTFISAFDGNLYLVGSTYSQIIGSQFFESNVKIEEIGGTPSLIFLGTNPPWSFGILGTAIALPFTGAILTIRKHRRDKTRHRRSKGPTNVEDLFRLG